MGTKKAALSLVLTGVIAIALVWWSADAFGLRSPIFAFLANWIAMSWVVLNGKIVEHPMPDKYYAPHFFERSGRIYELLGIRLFKATVRRGPLAIFSPTLKFPEKKSPEGLQRLEEEMRKAKAGHLIVLILVVLFALFLALWGHVDTAEWLLLFTIPINLYPIMLQRYNRVKLEELVSKRAAESHTG